jgi:hypothetical protein
MNVEINEIKIPFELKLLKRWKSREPEIVPEAYLNWNGPGTSNGYGFGEWIVEKLFTDKGYKVLNNDFNIVAKTSKYKEMITRIIDYGMSPQQAISEPRFVWGRAWGALTQDLNIEGRISRQVADQLSQAGHIVKIVEDVDPIMGHAHAILIDEQGFLHGGVDPRSDGAAVGI